MKLTIDFSQTDGVPLTNDLMDNIMEAIKLYDVIGSLAGHMTIITGCDPVSANSVAPGVVAINDEILFFEGGPLSTNVFISEQEITKTFQNQQDKVLIRKRSVKFGNATAPNLFPWSDFKKLQTIKDIQIALAAKANQDQVDDHENRLKVLEMKTAPIGNGLIVFLFRKPASEIPVGWKECTDFRKKTIFGYDPTAGGSWADLTHAGGSETVTLSKQNLPAIKIKTTVLQPYGGNSNLGGFDGGGNPWNNKVMESENLGSSQPIDITNPHRLVNFIEPNFQ
jgi:hypothetical protein